MFPDIEESLLKLNNVPKIHWNTEYQLPSTLSITPKLQSTSMSSPIAPSKTYVPRWLCCQGKENEVIRQSTPPITHRLLLTAHRNVHVTSCGTPTVQDVDTEDARTVWPSSWRRLLIVRRRKFPRKWREELVEKQVIYSWFLFKWREGGHGVDSGWTWACRTWKVLRCRGLRTS